MECFAGYRKEEEKEGEGNFKSYRSLRQGREVGTMKCEPEGVARG